MARTCTLQIRPQKACAHKRTILVAAPEQSTNNLKGAFLQEATTVSALTTNHKPDNLCRILSLDGGGAKGFYTLGVLKEIEAMIGCPLHKRFDLVFGTSTGAIIATLIALGYEVDQIHKLYKEHVPTIMSRKTRKGRTQALKNLVAVVFANRTFACYWLRKPA